MTQIVAVPAPITPDATLGCGIARAEIWSRGGSVRVLDLPNITATAWSRARSDTSDGSVEMDGVAIAADPDCCQVMRTIRPWVHELFIYRDDEMEWCGPITEMGLDGPKLTIKARDLSAWLDRRLIHSTHTWGGSTANQGGEDPQTIFLDITGDGWRSDFSPLRGVPAVRGDTELFTDTNNAFGAFELAQRTYTPAQFKMVAPELRDLAKGHLDWTVIKRQGKVNGSLIWQQVLPNPVLNPTFEVDVSNWTGLTRDTTVFHSGVASGRTAATPNVTGSITGLTVNEKYLMRVWIRGTSSAIAASVTWTDDLVFKVGNDQSSSLAWYVYGQPLAPTGDNRGRAAWFQIGVYFTATATTMPITLSGGTTTDSHGIYIDDLDVYQQVSSFTLRDYSLSVPPKITLSGLEQGNRQIVTNQQTGTGDVANYAESPKPQWTLGGIAPPGGVLTADQTEFGLLEVVTTQALSDGAGAGSSANQRAAMLSGTPLVLDSLVLSPEAGVTMDQLIPGVQFTLRLDEPCFAVQADLILQTVTVATTAGQGETVTLTFQPTGF